MTDGVLRLWLHMTCRRFLEEGRRIYACSNCKAIWDTTKKAAS